MPVFALCLLLTAGYLVVYAIYCFSHRRILPGAGALALALLPLGCAAIFVCISLGVSFN